VYQSDLWLANLSPTGVRRKPPRAPDRRAFGHGGLRSDKVASVVRDMGLFSEAPRIVEEAKEKLVPEEVEETRQAVQEVKDEARRSLAGMKDEITHE
jgi:hypothetical protein